MKLIDGIKLKGRPAEIPNCSRNDLPELFKELGFTTGVEIGVFEGAFTEILGKAGLKVYGVDPWLVYEDYGHPSYKDVAEKRYQKSLKRLAPYSNVTILREMSQDALKRFENESIDFVYIDGNHQFKYIAEDLYDWWKKVKKGGIICGHDYAYFKSRSPCGGCQVREVVDAYAKSFNIDFWVIGNYKREKPTDIRDDYRSWFFIKGDERDPKK
jgi:hypothetical protein